MNQVSEKKRLFIFIIFLSLLLIPLIAKLADIMLFRSQDDLEDTGRNPVIERGPILDRNGEILAIQTKLKTIAAWIPYVEDADESAVLLSEILDIKKDKILDTLTNSSHNYVFIKRKVTPTESGKITRLKEENKLKGILIDDEYARSYPHTTLVSHVTGYVDIDNNGLDGLELTCDDNLSPRVTGTRSKKIFGNQLFLTIDINIQYMVREIAVKAYETYKPDSIMILMMDATNGEIISYVSLPDFNPNEITKSSEAGRANLPIQYSYEPGSVFKIFTITSFLELGGITPSDEFHCTGIYDKIRDPITCLSVHGVVTPEKIIKYSCNVGAVYASETTESAPFYELLSSLGFGKKTGIPLPGETSGIFRPVSEWSPRTKPSIAFGQEISVSALQMITAATVLTNNGTLLKPIIVKKILSPEGKLIEEFTRTPVRKVFSPHTAYEMLKMMETATREGGTARRAWVDGVRISAKTGTAEVFDKGSGKYSDTHFIPSILGIFPTDDPKYILYIVIDHPKGENYYGSRVAAPLLKEIVENLVSMSGISSDYEKIIEHPGNIELPIPNAIELGSTMPDLTGIPKRLLLKLFKIEDITVYMKGEGYVVRQDPAPGTEITKGMKITLEFE
ncbi:MAG: transpeptidase family protein [Spirochaetales bacterium]|nr:transpeptidase family protein [Spirochaetales bacterium]